MKRTLIVQTGLMMNARWTRWLSPETAAANCTRPLVRYSQYCLIVLKGSAGSPGFAHNIMFIRTPVCMLIKPRFLIIKMMKIIIVNPC